MFFEKIKKIAKKHSIILFIFAFIIVILLVFTLLYYSVTDINNKNISSNAEATNSYEYKSCEIYENTYLYVNMV